jgi:transglutaminase-like putative cysteine protease
VELDVGYELIYDLPQPTPMLLVLHIHYTRASDILVPDHILTDPPVPLVAYRDGFGNWCSRIVAPAGRFRIASNAVVRDSGKPDTAVKDAQQHSIEDLPEEALVFLLASRYCDTEKLSQTAWDLFGQTQPGWARVQAICDYVNGALKFQYGTSFPNTSALDALRAATGVCRDYAQVAVTFCRALNIPARYAFGYLPDVDVPPPTSPMDFCAWFEAYLGDRWWTFDPRNNVCRVGHIAIARGRDALDTAMVTTYGDARLTGMTVWADRVA